MLVIRPNKMFKLCEIIKSLQGPSQMDFENHNPLDCSNKTTVTYSNNKVNILISCRDFHCFEDIGFAHVSLFACRFLKEILWSIICEQHAFHKKVLKPTESAPFQFQNSMICWCFLCFWFKTNQYETLKKRYGKTHLLQNSVKTNEILTFPFLRSFHRPKAVAITHSRKHMKTHTSYKTVLKPMKH